MRQKRILFVHSSNEMYGSDRMLLQVLRTLPRHAWNVQVFLPNDVEPAANKVSDHLAEAGVPHRSLPMPVLRRRYMSLSHLPFLLKSSLSVWRTIRRERPDVVLLTTSAMLPIALIAKLAGVTCVVLYAQEIWSGPERFVLSLLSRFVTTCVCISRAVRTSLPNHLRQKSRVIDNAVKDSSSPLVPLQGKHGPLQFVVASRWNAWKGHETLLKAWDLLPTPSSHLTILGGPPLSGVAFDVVGAVSRLRFPGTVTIVGEVDDIGTIVDRSDLLIVPSDSPEPFGLVAIEAFSRARGVVASAAGGLAEIVEDGVNGRLFRPGDWQELGELLDSLDRTAATSLGRAARQTFEDRYSTEAFANSFESLWRDASGHQRRE